jgi:hypothetical protein
MPRSSKQSEPPPGDLAGPEVTPPSQNFYPHGSGCRGNHKGYRNHDKGHRSETATVVSLKQLRHPLAERVAGEDAPPNANNDGHDALSLVGVCVTAGAA